MYYPIPEAVSDTQTVTVSLPKSECTPAQTRNVSASFVLQKSANPRSQKDNSVFYEVNRPTYGEWSKIKKSGSIKMTEMSIKNETHTYYLGQVYQPYIRWNWAHVASTDKLNGQCPSCNKLSPKKYVTKAAIVKGVYVEQGDIDYWKERFPLAPHYNSGMPELDQSAVEAAKSEAIAELYQSYNLGEEVAELKETILGVTKLLKEGILLLIRSRATIQSLLKKGYTKEASSRWMEFRYGIMPICYSIQDILEMNSEGKYATARRRVYSDVKDEDFSRQYDDDVYFETVTVGSVSASITAKARWGSQRIKNLDRINVNPLTTFTAVLPWSMVVRWFFNIQSYLDARVKSLTTMALEQHNCVAVREEWESVTYLSAVTGYLNERVFNPGDSVCGAGWFGVTEFGIYSDIRPNRTILARVTKNNYNRYLFKPTDVKLVFNPYMTWKRAIDSLILAKGPMSKLLRSLK